MDNVVEPLILIAVVYYNSAQTRVNPGYIADAFPNKITKSGNVKFSSWGALRVNGLDPDQEANIKH